jgi:hypothetical protein
MIRAKKLWGGGQQNKNIFQSENMKVLELFKKVV